MFSFLCKKTLLHSRNGYILTPQNPSKMVALHLTYFSSDANPHSFTVSYLINHCGLSPESALSASQSVQFETAEKPDLVITFFEKHGFSKAQISEIIRKLPKLLATNPEKVVFPKVEFFRSIGASTPDLVRIFTICPRILHRSLENHLIPSFNFFGELLESNEKAIAAVRSYPGILYHRLEDYVIPNINTLRENGVPPANVLFLVQCYPRTFTMNPDKFTNIVGEVREMGFNRLKSQFVLAIMILTTFSKSTREQKADAYKRWGWSDKDIMTAFRKYPWCMAISEDKIMAVMDFYVNKLGLNSSVIANRPHVLSLSLMKRLVPRAAVIEYLSYRGLVKLDSTIIRLFRCTEKLFLEKFVSCQEEASHLLKLYNDKLDLLKQQCDQQKGKKNM